MAKKELISGICILKPRGTKEEKNFALWSIALPFSKKRPPVFGG